MKIALVRVDSRLIHGQILEAWVPHTRAALLVVLNDEAAGSELARTVLTTCVPPTIRVIVARVAEAASLNGSPELADAPAIVLVATPADALAAHRAGLPFTRLNLGNLHYAPGKEQVSPTVCLGEEDRAALVALEARGVVIEAQAVPRERPRPYRELVRAR
ncbi:MAG TPA: PTS sugar transporter subunit IIB [Thermodesulfobacteriota bacterium]|nr:PTS sugar transporter subunit IIB [Thermodesulfobacteriota bacterium]